MRPLALLLLVLRWCGPVGAQDPVGLTTEAGGSQPGARAAAWEDSPPEAEAAAPPGGAPQTGEAAPDGGKAVELPLAPPELVDPTAAALKTRDEIHAEREAAMRELEEAKEICKSSGRKQRECASDQRVLLARARVRVLAEAWHRVDRRMPEANKLRQELQARESDLTNATETEKELSLRLRREAGDDRDLWWEIQVEQAAVKNASLLETAYKDQLRTLEQNSDEERGVVASTYRSLVQFRVRLQGIIRGLDVGDKFAEQTFVDAEDALTKANERNAHATKITLRAERLINGTQGWLQKQQQVDQQLAEQRAKDLTAQKQVEMEAKADSRILRGLVRENRESFGTGHAHELEAGAGANGQPPAGGSPAAAPEGLPQEPEDSDPLPPEASDPLPQESEEPVSEPPSPKALKAPEAAVATSTPTGSDTVKAAQAVTKSFQSDATAGREEAPKDKLLDWKAEAPEAREVRWLLEEATGNAAAWDAPPRPVAPAMPALPEHFGARRGDASTEGRGLRVKRVFDAGGYADFGALARELNSPDPGTEDGSA